MPRRMLAISSGGGGSNTFTSPLVDTAGTVTWEPTLTTNIIWSGGASASITHTFATTGTDCVWTYSNGVANLSTGSLQVGGVAVKTTDAYALQAGTTFAFVQTDNQTYYFGCPNDQSSPNDEGMYRIYIPKAGTLKALYVQVLLLGTPAGSGELVNFYVRKNATTDLLNCTADYTSALVTASNTAGATAVAAGDFIEVKIVTPMWSSAPAGNTIPSATILIES